MFSSDSVYLCPFTRTNKHKKAVIKNRCNLATRMIRLENAGLWAPRKISLGSGLHSQKSIRAPVSKMIGLRALQQKFQGSRAPGTPPFGTLYSGPHAMFLQNKFIIRNYIIIVYLWLQLMTASLYLLYTCQSYSLKLSFSY